MQSTQTGWFVFFRVPDAEIRRKIENGVGNFLLRRRLVESNQGDSWPMVWGAYAIVDDSLPVGRARVGANMNVRSVGVPTYTTLQDLQDLLQQHPRNTAPGRCGGDPWWIYEFVIPSESMPSESMPSESMFSELIVDTRVLDTVQAPVRTRFERIIEGSQ